jgi:hypothetical protein
MSGLVVVVMASMVACTSSATPTKSGAATGSAASKSASAAVSQRLIADLVKDVATIRSAHVEASYDTGQDTANDTGDVYVNVIGDENFVKGGVSTAALTIDDGKARVPAVWSAGSVYVKIAGPINKSGRPWLRLSAASPKGTLSDYYFYVRVTVESYAMGSLLEFAKAGSEVRVQTGPSAAHPQSDYNLFIETAQLTDSSLLTMLLRRSGTQSVPASFAMDPAGRPLAYEGGYVFAGGYPYQGGSNPRDQNVGYTKFNQRVTVAVPPAGEVGTP